MPYVYMRFTFDKRWTCDFTNQFTQQRVRTLRFTDAEKIRDADLLYLGKRLDQRPGLGESGCGFQQAVAHRSSARDLWVQRRCRERLGYNQRLQRVVPGWSALRTEPGTDQIAMSWGVMDMTRSDRFARAINAGVDQAGGTEDVSALLEAEKNGKLSEARIKEAAKRILVQKFSIGLFEKPYVDAVAAKDTVGNPASLKAGQEAQKQAMVLLENKHGILPIRSGMKVWLFHISVEEAKAHGLVVVDTPAQAEIAIIRAETPAENRIPASSSAAVNTRAG
jgi:hypothetical protein